MNNLINQIRTVSYEEANSIIREISGIVNYFSSEDEKSLFTSTYEENSQLVCDNRVSYGDWQTPKPLADKVCDNHLLKFGEPDIIIEPTCGLGSFVFSALERFSKLSEVHALEINYQYTIEFKLALLISALKQPYLKRPDIYIYHKDFYDFDFAPIIKKAENKSWNLAIIGNPPWVTNSRQGKNNSKNVPFKQNNYKLKGIDAITGKSNFDISEYITLHLLGLAQLNKGGISFLLKNSVIRNILSKQKATPLTIGQFEQKLIDAPSEFDVSVDASCFSAKFNCNPSLLCTLKDFYTDAYIREYGWVNNSFVSDTSQYQLYSNYDNHSTYVWRSGVKHDCASVLELTLVNGRYINGLGEYVKIETDLIYPLLKSSDVNNHTPNQFKRFIIIPQHKVGEDLTHLEQTHPLAYSYLMKHEEAFSKRKSNIYKGKGKFSIFGIGEYSFKPYKIVVSSLYKNIKFILVSPLEGKPTMVDDTCYQLDFDSIEEASSLYEAICSHEIQSLLKSLIFTDAKRVITKSLLMRLNLVQLCNTKGIRLNTTRFKHSLCQQPSLFD